MKLLILFCICAFQAMGCCEAADWFAILTGAPLPPIWLRAVTEAVFAIVLFGLAVWLGLASANPHTPQREGD